MLRVWRFKNRLRIVSARITSKRLPSLRRPRLNRHQVRYRTRPGIETLQQRAHLPARDRNSVAASSITATLETLAQYTGG